MKTSKNGIEFITREEGCVLHVYRDQAGLPTIGVGHLLRPGEAFPAGITQAQAEEMLARDIGVAEEAINRLVTASIGQNAFDALASFTFNCGTGALQTSSILRLLNQGETEAAADSFQLWCHITVNGVREVSRALLNRRDREAALFLTPDVAPLDVA